MLSIGPRWRWSCSFGLVRQDGSPALTITMPATTPTYGMVEIGSPATIKPKCFMAQIERAPASEAANAISRQIFSLTEYSKTIPRSGLMRANVSVTSDEGVPG